MKEKNKGITLIALVITIIVMLILVGVTVNVAFSENGIVTKAREAAKLQKEAEIKEKIQTAIASSYDNFLDNLYSRVGVNLEEVDYNGFLNMGNLENQLRTAFEEDPEIEVLGYMNLPLSVSQDYTYAYFYDMLKWESWVITGEGTGKTEEQITAKFNELTNENNELYAEMFTNEAIGPNGSGKTYMQQIIDGEYYTAVLFGNNWNLTPITGKHIFEIAFYKAIIDRYTVNVKYGDTVFSVSSIGEIDSDNSNMQISFGEANVLYEYESNGENITILKYRGPNINKLVIPQKIGGYTVTQIGKGTNGENSSPIICSQKVPLSQESLGCEFNQANIENIKAALTSPGAASMFGLTEEDITEINSMTTLEQLIEFTNAAQENGQWYAYQAQNADRNESYFAPKVNEVVLPETIETIGYGAFQNSRVTKINIPDAVEEITYHTFDHCGLLQEVNISENSALTEIRTSAFEGCTQLNNISIPRSVTYIGEDAFSGSSLSGTITFNPTTSLQFNYNAFKETNIEKIVFEGNVSLMANAFADCSNLRTIYVPASLISTEYSIGQAAFSEANSELTIYIYTPENWGNTEKAQAISTHFNSLTNVTYVWSDEEAWINP